MANTNEVAGVVSVQFLHDPRVDYVIEQLFQIKQILQEAHLSDISPAIQELRDAVTGVMQRVNEDVAHLQDLVAQAGATAATDAARIQQLVDEAAATAAQIGQTTATLQTINPDPNFPPAPPAEQPPVVPPPDQPPTI